MQKSHYRRENVLSSESIEKVIALDFPWGLVGVVNIQSLTVAKLCYRFILWVGARDQSNQTLLRPSCTLWQFCFGQTRMQGFLSFHVRLIKNKGCLPADK